MSWKQLKALTEQRGQALADMKALLKKAEDEKRDLTADENTQFAELNTRSEGLKTQIERYEQAQKLEGELAQRNGGEQRAGREDVNTPEQTAEQDATEARSAFNEFCRTGEIRATNTITTATGGGAYVPKTVLGVEGVAKLGNSLKACHSFYGMPAIEVSGKGSFSVPVIDLADGGEVAGDAEAEELGNRTDSSVLLNVTTYNSKPQWLDNGIVTIASYDAAGSLVPTLQVACDRGEEAAWFTASITTNANKTAAVETAVASTVSYGDLSKLLFALGAYAIGRCAYLVSMSVLAAMHGMTDSNGRPVDKLTKDGSGQYFWDGVPVFATTALSAIADGNYVAAVLNCDAARIAASQPWVKRYDQNSGRPNQTGFDLLQYAAFGVKAGAVKLLKVKAA